jgi:glycine cleavage system H protein
LIQVHGYAFDETAKYTKDHLWIKAKDEISAVVGLTDFFLKRYRNIQSEEFPKVGSTVTRNASMGKIETVKGTVELYAPISGQVKSVNSSFLSRISNMTDNPYSEGWIVEIEPANFPLESGDLLSSDQYSSYIGKLVDAGL